MTDESHGDTAAPAEVPRHIGALDRRPERPLILVVAHAAGSQLFGGERSLLTLLDGLDAAGLDTLVALPLGPDPVYRDAVALCRAAGASITLATPRIQKPDEMGICPVFSIPKVLKKLGLTVNDIDLWELNEAFAVQVLYCRDKLGISNDRLNVNGGAIALGHRCDYGDRAAGAAFENAAG